MRSLNPKAEGFRDMEWMVYLESLEPGAWAGQLLGLGQLYEVEPRQDGVALLGGVPQDEVVDGVLIDLAVAVHLEGGDAVEDALCLPRHPGNPMHRPPHPAHGQDWLESPHSAISRIFPDSGSPVAPRGINLP